MSNGSGYSHCTTDGLFRRPLENRDADRLEGELQWLRQVGDLRSAIDHAGRQLTLLGRLLQTPRTDGMTAAIVASTDRQLAAARKSLDELQLELHNANRKPATESGSPQPKPDMPAEQRAIADVQGRPLAMSQNESEPRAHPKPRGDSAASAAIPNVSTNPFDRLLPGNPRPSSPH